MKASIMSRQYPEKKMDKRKKARHRETRNKPSKTNILMSFEYHREKAGYPLIGRKKKIPRNAKCAR
jgi:hypothetical protein